MDEGGCGGTLCSECAGHIRISHCDHVQIILVIVLVGFTVWFSRNSTGKACTCGLS